MKTGWYNSYEYYVVKPLHNGHEQSLIMGAQGELFGRWYLVMGIFSDYDTYDSVFDSNVWDTPTSTDKKPSMKVIPLALEALSEIEQEIHNHANGKRAYLYVDGMDKRRLMAYTRILTRKCGYKISTKKSDYVSNAPMLYKKV